MPWNHVTLEEEDRLEKQNLVGGEIFEDPRGHFYIYSQVDDRKGFRLINLANGNRWSEDDEIPEDFRQIYGTLKIGIVPPTIRRTTTSF